MSQNNNFPGQALNHIVIVKQIENKQESKSGLDLTSVEDKNQKYRKGIVKSIGNLCPKDDDGKPHLNVGDTIMYDGYKVSPITVNSEVYDCVYFSDVTMIL